MPNSPWPPSSASTSQARPNVFAPVKKHGDLYKHYQKTYRTTDDKTSGNPVSSPVFNAMWRDSFPQLKLRNSCNITGTCPICAAIDSKRKSGGGDAVVHKKLRIAHTLHRPFFVGPRAAYHDMVQHALANPVDVFSIAIDIMESMNLQLPHGGGQVKFNETIDSNFVGVLVHGKTASLIMEVYNCWINEKGGNAKIVYLQVDGGSENTQFLVFPPFH